MTGTDIESATRRSRRSLLAAAAGAAAATAAATLARPLSAAAANGDPLILGQQNQADTETTLDGRLLVSQFLQVQNLGPDPQAAVIGVSLNGAGVYGQSEGASAGVRGVATDPAGVAVSAASFGEGTGLFVQGKVRLHSRSGRATVAAGRRSVDVDLIRGGLAGTPLCFANLMSYRPGVFVTTVRPNYPAAHKIRIYLNRTVSANTFVAWFVLN